ncbi:DNA-formamidopyrimidine glycosylase family protein, partial [Pseudoalteromonas sp. S983]|uniref:DNA-formamidopyrimidine glycosylase family protein n=1 Tax=Pseudoalteromonas sp. S983 TaxID=579572 RepID=UPI00126FE9AA
MPELPEVEVSRLGISPHIEKQTVSKVLVHNASLCWPVPDEVKDIEGLTINSVRRRAKYLMLDTDIGSVILHLGMSGHLRIVPISEPLKKHDHVEI